MTPVRARRTSKAPNRFTNDTHNETSSSEAITDYTDQSSNTTVSKTIGRGQQNKTISREPLKVKLPVFRRPQQAPAKESSTKTDISMIRITKIKLPSFASKKFKADDGKSVIPPSRTDVDKPTEPGKISSLLMKSRVVDFSDDDDDGDDDHNDDSNDDNEDNDEDDSQDDDSRSKQPSTPFKFIPNLDTKSSSARSILAPPTAKDSETSVIPRSSKSFSADTSMSSEAEDSVSGMEIIVSKNESSNNSGIKCPCEVDDDLGFMLECEKCLTWQHGHCTNVSPISEDDVEGYVCAFCKLPQGKARESLRQLIVGDSLAQKFEQLSEARKRLSEQPNSTTTGVRFTVSELSQAVEDLRRVSFSLDAKWKLFTSQAYETELRIWQNPYWSDDPNESSGHEKSFYFMDRCKGNLKLNIRNMIKKIEERCLLVDYSISSNSVSSGTDERGNPEASGQQTSVKIDQARRDVEEFLNRVREFKTKL